MKINQTIVLVGSMAVAALLSGCVVADYNDVAPYGSYYGPSYNPYYGPYYRSYYGPYPYAYYGPYFHYPYLGGSLVFGGRHYSGHSGYHHLYGRGSVRGGHMGGHGGRH